MEPNSKPVTIPYPDDCEGQLVVISGFSGAGKDTVVKKLMEMHSNYAYSVSATTRKPRKGEVDGKDYFFLSKQEFRYMKKNGGFLETTTYCGEEYGTPFISCMDLLKKGVDTVLILDTAGALSVKDMYPTAILIFLAVPDFNVLERRIRKRGVSEDTVMERMKQACQEVRQIPKYDYVVSNETGKAYDCAEEIYTIVCTQKAKTSSRLGFIEQLYKQAEDWKTKGENHE